MRLHRRFSTTMGGLAEPVRNINRSRRVRTADRPRSSHNFFAVEEFLRRPSRYRGA